MKALRLIRSTPIPLLVEEEIPRPEPGAGEVLVRVHAVAVTPTEVQWYDLRLPTPALPLGCRQEQLLDQRFQPFPIGGNAIARHLRANCWEVLAQRKTVWLPEPNSNSLPIG